MAYASIQRACVGLQKNNTFFAVFLCKSLRSFRSYSQWLLQKAAESKRRSLCMLSWPMPQ